MRTQSTTFTTPPVKSEARSELLSIEADAPEQTSLTVTVLQDVDGDGEAEREQTIPVNNRENDYELDQFVEGGYSYSLSFRLEAETDSNKSPDVHSASLEGVGEVLYNAE